MFSLKASTILGASGVVKSVVTVAEPSAPPDHDLIPCLDFEDRLKEKEKDFVSAEDKQAFVYPSNELTISMVPRLNSGLDSIFLGVDEVPLPSKKSPEDGFVSRALDRFARDYVTVSARFDEYSGRTLPKKPLDWNDPSFTPAVSLNDAVEAPSPLNESFADISSSKLGKIAKKKKGLKLPSLFSFCDLPASPSDTRPVSDLPRWTGYGDGSSAKVQALVHIKVRKKKIFF